MIRCGGAVFVVYLLFTVVSIADDKVISLATLEWPPYVGKELNNYGVTVEIVTTCFRNAGYEVEINFLPWPRALEYVREGKLDAAFPAYYSDERAQEFALSEPFAKGPLVFFKRKNKLISFTSLEGLKGYRIGVVYGYVNASDFDDADYLDKRAVNSDKQNLSKLIQNRIDLAVIDLYTANHILKTELPEGVALLEPLLPPFREMQLYVAFSKKSNGYEQIRKAFNVSLKKLRDEGRLASILQKYDVR